MKTLLLMRHGDAPQARTDKERMLSDLGREQCRQMSGYIDRLSLSKVITSDYQRAIDSASIVVGAAQEGIQFMKNEFLRPMADPKIALNFICDEFEKTESLKTMLVVCHMPLISELTSLAIDGSLKNHYSFPCASLMKLSSNFAATGCFSLVEHVVPD